MNLKDASALFKQARDMQAKMAAAQQELAGKTVEVNTGGGMVKVTANGLSELISLHIDPELINMQDKGILEDLILGAVNEVQRKANDLRQEEMAKLTGGLNIPGMFAS
jgi:DNA-binding YbaB/EbfC family protein